MSMILPSISACITRYHDSTPPLNPVFVSDATISFMKKNNAPIEVRQNISDIQAGAVAADEVIDKDSLTEINTSMAKYFVAAGLVISGWWLTTKVFFSSIF